MNIIRLYRALRCFVVGLLFVAVAVFLITAILEFELENLMDRW